ncbi:MAG TPA: hypothetical protein VGO79_13010 [Thermoanaerobaculia bacterium]|jgi:hypothetical protein
MRLPARVAAQLSLIAAVAAPLALAQQSPELAGGQMSQSPQAITRIEATAPQTTEAAPQPLGSEAEVACFGYLGPTNEGFDAEVIGAQEVSEQTDFTTNNLLYLDAGADRGLKPGDEFWIVTPGDEVLHPSSGRDLGRFYDYRGRAVVLCVEAHTATVRVTHACTDIPMGSFLKTYEPIPIPLGRKSPPAVACDPPSGKAKGRIVYTRDGVYQIGTDTDVLVDLGLAEGLQPGDFLTIYRYNYGFEYGIRPQGTYWVNLPPPEGVQIPRTYLGELAILSVGDRWATARVTDANRLIEVGDEVELK